MLVLSRRRDETIMIGDDVEITIVDIKGDTVRIGISAPKSVSVHRKEIYEAIQAENIAAAQHQLVPDAAAVGGLTALLARPAGPPSAAALAAGRLRPAPTVPPAGAPASGVQPQPQPGVDPGAAPVAAKSLASMFKRK